MKVKVKGLVFVGFAAAIFSANAMAADGDAKIVTSKLYVDSKFSGTAGQVITQGATTGATTYTDVGNDKNYINTDTTGTNHGSGVLVTGKAVKEALNDLSNAVSGVVGDNVDIKVDSSTSNGVTTKTIKLQNTRADTNASITGTLDTDAKKNALVSAQGVASLKATSVASGDTTHFPTGGAVYTYAQPKLTTASADGKVSIGYKVDGSDASWGTLQEDATSGATKYVKLKRSGTTSTYNVNIDSNQITNATTDFTGTVTNGVWGGPSDTQKAKLVKAETINSLINKEATMGTTTITDAVAGNATVPTSKNVYDFVTGKIAAAGNEYQPKVGSSDNYNKVVVGYTTRSGSGTDTSPYVYSSEWKQLSGSTYVTSSISSGNPTIALTNLTGTAATDLLNASSSTGAVTALTSGNKVKLVKAGAVESLVAYESNVGTTTITSAASGNGKVPTSKNVYDFVESNKLKAGSTSGGTIGSNTTDDSKVPTVKNVVQYVGSIFGGGLTIPAPTGECASTNMTDSNDTACALVLAYWPVDTTNGITTAGVQLKWVKMAQAQ